MVRFDLLPVITSLITGELARSRHVSALDPLFLDLTPGTEIGNGALATDSLDLLNLAGAVAEMFHLYETTTEEYLLRYRKVEQWCEVVRVSLEKSAEQLTFRSSGSTGAGKRCVHSLDRLTAEAREHAGALGPFGRVLSMVPGHHIYGFIWSALLPAELALPVVDVRRWSPARIAREVRRGDLLVGVPANWGLLSGSLDLFPAGVLGVTSGAPCPPELFKQVTNGGVHLQEIYGSSETAGIGCRQRAGEAFALLAAWKRGESGQDLIRTDRSREVVSVPDRLSWVSEREFFVAGRRDGAVQVSGNNVYPEQVAEVIRSFPGVRDCAVRLMRPEEGQRLKAFVAWNNAECDEAGLRDWVDAKLQPFERPGAFTSGPALPVNEMNKLSDWRITE